MKRPQWIPQHGDFPGLALAGLLGAIAFAAAHLLPPSPLVSDILVAMVIGALIINTPARRWLGLRPPAAEEREPDRAAAGLRFVGKWVLRLGIILMGLKVQTGFFGRSEVLVIAGIAAVSLPSAYFFAHTLGAAIGLRREMSDLLAGGTMICGASAINAIAPVTGARREEQGIAIGVVFLFSVVALVAFHPLAMLVGLPSSYSGLWSGLAVNDLASAIAVGSQMGGVGEAMATASKSARILLLAPILLLLSWLRHSGKKANLTENLPRFILGYIALAIVRGAGDRAFGQNAAWHSLIVADQFAVDWSMATVAAAIGLHLELKRLLAAGARAIVVGGGASALMAGLTFAMIVALSHGAQAAAALIGLSTLAASFVAYRLSSRAGAELARLRQRFDAGAPLSLGEATLLLDAAEPEGLDEAVLRRILVQLHPSIGELIPVRENPLPHGQGCRWNTYWEGKSGWALVALCREAGSVTPIHAHPHRLIGKAIEGVLEELRFAEPRVGELELTHRGVLAHNQLVETEALATVHVLRVAGAGAAIDLQFRGPEIGRPGRRFRPNDVIDLTTLSVGTHLLAQEEPDDRPGYGGEGHQAGI